MTFKRSLLFLLLLAILVSIAVYTAPSLNEKAGIITPQTVYNGAKDNSGVIKPCSNDHPEWRPAQEIDGVSIEAAPACEPDNPYEVATSVKGTNNVSMATLMQTDLAQDALMEYFKDATDIPALRTACEDLEHELKDLRLAFGVELKRGDWKEIENNPKIAGGLDALNEQLQRLTDQLKIASVRELMMFVLED